jgi:hypothetical protein
MSFPPVPPSKHWDRFTMLVWQYKTDVMKDKALYESLNLRGFHVDRQNGKLQAFAKESGWPYYVDHAADKGFLHLGKRVDPISGKKDVVQRPNSLADPKVMAEVRRSSPRTSPPRRDLRGGLRVRRRDQHRQLLLADRGRRPSPRGRRVSQVPGEDVRHGREAERPVRDDVRLVRRRSSPGATRRCGSSSGPTPSGSVNLSPWCDWRSAMDTQWADALADLTRTANGVDAEVPAGFVGGQGPALSAATTIAS